MSLHEGASAFLLQTWQEFFDQYTPDSYQPRLHHTASLIGELEDIAERAITDTRWHPHIALIKAELRQVATSEAGFLGGLPRYQWTISELLKLDKPRDIVSLSKTLQAERVAYNLHTAATIRACMTGLPKRKEDARIAIHRVATNFLQSGRADSQALALVTDANLSKTPTEIADILLTALSDSVDVYRSILALRGEMSAVQHIARKVGFSLLAPDKLQASGEVDEFLTLASGSVLVEKTSKAAFPGEAAKNATQELRHAIELYNFYKHGPALDLSPTALVQKPITAEATIVSPGEPGLRRLKPRKNTVQLTHGTIEGIEADRLTGYLRNALEHCSLALRGRRRKFSL